MATKRKLENPDDAELDAVRAKIRELEGTLQSLKDRELQLLKNDLVDNRDQEAQVEGQQEVIDFLSVFINNQGFKRIADKIFTFLDCNSFVNCRSVCSSWKNYIDNEWSTLQLQIFHLAKYPGYRFYPGLNRYEPYSHLLNAEWFNDYNFGPLIEVMKKNKNKSELRVFINLCREFVPKHFDLIYEENGIIQFLVDRHRHQELIFILDCPEVLLDAAYNARDFRYACENGCESCVKPFLDRTEKLGIDLNYFEKFNEFKHGNRDIYEFEHCLFAANANIEENHKEVLFKKGVLDLLLRSAEEKGININVKNRMGRTIRDQIIWEISDIRRKFEEIDDYSEATFKILKIKPIQK